MGVWIDDDIRDQHDRTAVITGANSGLGLRAATVLAAKGARVILACRSRERGERAAAAVGGELVLLDLADLDSVRTAAADIRDRTGDRVDLLIDNAGIPAGRLRRTAEGHESIFATNYLGHAALTWLLMPALRAGGVGPARIDPRAQDQSLRARLWERTAELTGVRPDPA